MKMQLSVVYLHLRYLAFSDWSANEEAENILTKNNFYFSSRNSCFFLKAASHRFKKRERFTAQNKMRTISNNILFDFY